YHRSTLPISRELTTRTLGRMDQSVLPETRCRSMTHKVSHPLCLPPRTPTPAPRWDDQLSTECGVPPVPKLAGAFLTSTGCSFHSYAPTLNAPTACMMRLTPASSHMPALTAVCKWGDMRATIGRRRPRSRQAPAPHRS